MVGGAEITLADRGESQELVVCGGSLDYGGVSEAVAEEIGKQVREILFQNLDDHAECRKKTPI